MWWKHPQCVRELPFYPYKSSFPKTKIIPSSLKNSNVFIYKLPPNSILIISPLKKIFIRVCIIMKVKDWYFTFCYFRLILFCTYFMKLNKVFSERNKYTWVLLVENRHPSVFKTIGKWFATKQQLRSQAVKKIKK